MPSLFPQNVIAVIWDFDKTLIPGYMQDPLFRHYGVDAQTFWDEANGLEQFYRTHGLELVSPDTLYLNHTLTYVREGVFDGLNNQMLRMFGQQLDFCEGVPDVFPRLKNLIETDARFSRHEITVEHYIVSTGLRQIIQGSSIAEHVEDVWACEFVEDVAPAGYLGRSDEEPRDEPSVIREIGYVIDNTTKTRAVFEINKGTNKLPEINVNASIPEEERRVPFENMIYVADGPSDIPVFSVVKRFGGKAYAVFDPSSKKSFAQSHDLLEAGRVHAVGPADYRAGGQADMWLSRELLRIAERMLETREGAVASRVGRTPRHIIEPRTVREAATPYAMPLTTVRELVDDLLARVGIDSAPVPLAPVLKELGIELSAREKQKEDAVVVPMTDPSEGAPTAWTVYYNPDRPESRRRFTIAHEAGHVVLHGAPRGGAAAARGGGGNKTLEREADSFAAELLMPRSFVHAAVADLGVEPEALASRFEVSVDAMSLRLNELGISKPPLRKVPAPVKTPKAPRRTSQK